MSTCNRLDLCPKISPNIVANAEVNGNQSFLISALKTLRFLLPGNLPLLLPPVICKHQLQHETQISGMQYFITRNSILILEIPTCWFCSWGSSRSSFDSFCYEGSSRFILRNILICSHGFKQGSPRFGGPFNTDQVLSK